MSALWRHVLALACPAALWAMAHAIITADARRQARELEQERAGIQAERDPDESARYGRPGVGRERA